MQHMNGGEDQYNTWVGKGLSVTREWGLCVTRGWRQGSSRHIRREGTQCDMRVEGSYPWMGRDSTCHTGEWAMCGASGRGSV